MHRDFSPKLTFVRRTGPHLLPGGGGRAPPKEIGMDPDQEELNSPLKVGRRDTGDLMLFRFLARCT